MVASQALHILGGCTLAVLATPVAHAHGIESTLERLGRSTLNSPYQLESKFSTGVPARDAAVRMVSPTGDSSIALGHTNGEGQLTFTLPEQARADWEVQVDAGPGHRDYLELAESTDAAGASSPSPSSAMANPVRTPGWLRERSPLLGTGLLLGLSLSAAGVLAWRQRSR